MPELENITGLAHERAVVVAHPLLGRANANNNQDPTYHVFGQVASDPTAIAATLNSQRDEARAAGSTKGCREAEYRMRRIRSSGIELVRQIPEGETGPLQLAQIVAPFEGGNRVTNFSVLVDAATPEGMTTFLMDVGETIDILTAQVNLTVVGPTGSALVPPSIVEQASFGGLVSDARISMAVSSIESADGGHRRVRFSELYRLPDQTLVNIPIPSCAVEVKVQMAVGVAGSWDLLGSITTNPLPMGTVDFDANGLYSLDETREVGSASFLRPEVGQGDRLAQLIWQIEP